MGAVKDLVEKYSYFQGHFFEFMNDVIAFTKTKTNDL